MSSQETFIVKVGAIVIKEVNTRKRAGKKWILPSVCIAQAALESAFGTSALMTYAHAYFGIKANKNWKGKVFSAKTKECYDGKNLVNITDYFRAYNSLEESIADYYDLLTTVPRYSKACNNTSALNTITEIKKAGYATAPNYVDAVMDIIKRYHLTDYDKGGDIKEEPKPKKKTPPANNDKGEYYKKYEGNTTSIIEALRAVGCKDTSLAFRATIAVKNGISTSIASYRGTAQQNTKMLKMLKDGVLKK